MTIQYKRREARHTVIEPTAITCDRCRENLGYLTGGSRKWNGTFIESYLWRGEPPPEQYEWQLCVSCTDDLRGWIGNDGELRLQSEQKAMTAGD